MKLKLKCIALMIMTLISLISLLAVSTLTYIYKWQADKALIGITITYILAGFSGGLFLRLKTKESISIGRKMLEACCLSISFMILLVIVSIFLLKNPFAISSRFLMIFMLFVGSTCLGRIL